MIAHVVMSDYHLETSAEGMPYYISTWRCYCWIHLGRPAGLLNIVIEHFILPNHGKWKVLLMFHVDVLYILFDIGY